MRASLNKIIRTSALLVALVAVAALQPTYAAGNGWQSEAGGQYQLAGDQSWKQLLLAGLAP